MRDEGRGTRDDGGWKIILQLGFRSRAGWCPAKSFIFLSADCRYKDIVVVNDYFIN